MNFKEAKKECRKVGTAHATGDALRSMYAELVAVQWPAIGNAPKVYEYLQRETGDDKSVYELSRELLRDHSKALDIVLS